MNESTVQQMVGSGIAISDPVPSLFPDDEGRSVPVVSYGESWWR